MTDVQLLHMHWPSTSVVEKNTLIAEYAFNAVYLRPTHNDLYEDNTIWDLKFEALRIRLIRAHGKT